MLVRNLILIIALTIFSMLCGMWVAQASAATPDVVEITACHITQSQKYENPTQIFCNGDLVIADGVKIEAPGLQLVAVGNLMMGKEDQALRVIAGKGAVVVYARTAVGQIEVEAGTVVQFKYTSVYEYEQKISAPKSASVSTVINGESLKLQGPYHKISRDI